MNETRKKQVDFLKIIFGYGIMLALFVGGLTFFGYLLALIIGGDAAMLICEIIYKKVIPIVIYISTVMVLLGILIMYLAGEKALTPSKRQKAKIDQKK